MSSTKLLILMAVVLGLLAAPAWSAEGETGTAQGAEATAAPADESAEPADAEAGEMPPSEHGDVASEADAAAPGLPASAAAALAIDSFGDVEADDTTLDGVDSETEIAASEAALDLSGTEVAPPAAPAVTTDAMNETATADAMAEAADDMAPLEGEIDPMVAVPASLDAADGPATTEAGSDALSDAEMRAALNESPALGAVGYDSKGRRGRIHVVQPADTLWDISETYLGTPWVWPSIWQDNEQVANPHVIEPGDRIWITPTEMRRISAAEAAALLAGTPPEPAAAEEFPIATEEIEIPIEPEAVPEIPVVPEERPTQLVSARESTGMISVEQLQSAASIVGRIPERVLLSQEDEVYIGIGESRAEVGDQFTIFRTHEKVFDPDTGELLGYHIELLGWVAIEETFPETSRARIEMSTGDVELGDSLIPRDPLPTRISVQESPDGVEGKISFFPNKRVLMSYNDFVYLNRGTDDGVQVGSPLEVYRPGYPTLESSRGQEVEVPDRVIAQLLVVRAHTEASVAVVTHTNTELAMGDRFRGATE
jgi:nucleoid-associated protein YgaU